MIKSGLTRRNGLTRCVRTNSGQSLPANIAALFANGEKGGIYLPSFLSSNFQNTGGTTPVAVGDPVGRANDQSPNSANITQAGATLRPLLQQDAQGKYYFDFDGSNDGLQTNTGIDLSGTDKVTYWLALLRKTDIGTQIPLSYGGVTAATQFSLEVGSGVNLSRFQIGGPVNRVDTTAYGINTKYIYSCVMDRAAAQANQIKPRVNKVALGAAAGSAVAGNFGNHFFSLGFNNTGQPANVRIYGAIVLGRAATPQEVADVEDYLNTLTGAY